MNKKNLKKGAHFEWFSAVFELEMNGCRLQWISKGILRFGLKNKLNLVCTFKSSFPMEMNRSAIDSDHKQRGVAQLL